jgi:hypothetical protein
MTNESEADINAAIAFRKRRRRMVVDVDPFAGQIFLRLPGRLYSTWGCGSMRVHSAEGSRPGREGFGGRR